MKTPCGAVVDVKGTEKIERLRQSAIRFLRERNHTLSEVYAMDTTPRPKKKQHKPPNPPKYKPNQAEAWTPPPPRSMAQPLAQFTKSAKLLLGLRLGLLQELHPFHRPLLQAPRAGRGQAGPRLAAFIAHQEAT